MTEEKKNKILTTIVRIAFCIAILVGFFSFGRLLVHDIPTLIRGEEEIVIEYTEEDDWMGVPKEIATKTVKKKVSFEDGIGMVLTNLLTGIVCAGLIIVILNPEITLD